MKNQLEKLEQHFNQQELNNSWFYAALKKIVNEKDAVSLPVSQGTTKDFNIQEMKQELIEYTLTLNNHNLIKNIVVFIEKNFKHAYYFNIMQAIISILKKIEENIAIEEAKSIIYQKRMDLSGFEISIINNLLPSFYENENKQIKIYK